MSQDTDVKFIQDFQTKLNDMTKSNSTVNQKILSELKDIQGKVSTILGNIKSLQRKISECTQKTNDVNNQIQQNKQSIQSSASPDQVAALQQIATINQTKQQAMDAIQKSIVVLDNYRNSSDTDVNSIKSLIDEIKAALMTASTAATTSGDSGGVTGFLGALFGSSPAAAVVTAPLVQEKVPSDLEIARAEEMEKQKMRVDERTRELKPQEKQQINGDRQMAQGIADFQQKQQEQQIPRDEKLAINLQREENIKELQQQATGRGGKKTRKSKKRGGNNKSKRRGKNKKHLPKKK